MSTVARAKADVSVPRLTLVHVTPNSGTRYSPLAALSSADVAPCASASTALGNLPKSVISVPQRLSSAAYVPYRPSCDPHLRLQRRARRDRARTVRRYCSITRAVNSTSGITPGSYGHRATSTRLLPALRDADLPFSRVGRLATLGIEYRRATAAAAHGLHAGTAYSARFELLVRESDAHIHTRDGARLKLRARLAKEPFQLRHMLYTLDGPSTESAGPACGTTSIPRSWPDERNAARSETRDNWEWTLGARTVHLFGRYVHLSLP
ncbi:hypothetical protein EXIGLDRAFT_771446 [Exidia glandulosa HHB12029]|uniref:Uncharacterized protein n=1 Tax=Exidia glandulosa HHB12029 TaxID=1314781 RepID=A0A165FZN1_EXIGL|nr:hypothetical protein EXIGLDRAFT_771446 [Exidia glandulosa HHB12029]